LWRHAMGCALGSQWLARRLNYQELEDESFIGGLIHDVGKLLLMKVLDDIEQSGEIETNISEALVLELLAATHTQQGYILAKEWQLPEGYCTVVRDHHNEELDTGDTLQLLVRLANHACNQLGIGLVHEPTLILSATEEAYYLGAKDILLAELQIMLEDSKSLAV
jgi:HD-like signal output (HDOD) protein